jgi:GNAT superfamily N-acetyltransferase
MQQAVRALALRDCTEVSELEREAREAMSEQRGGPAHLAEVAAVHDWTTLVDHPDRSVWVGTIDDVVVGYLELTRHGHLAEVRQVYVRLEARELGFGDWLLEAALSAARAAGCTVLEGTALPGDRDTKNLYERAGIKARKITVSIVL